MDSVCADGINQVDTDIDRVRVIYTVELLTVELVTF